MTVTIRPLCEGDAFKSFLWRNDKEVFALTTKNYDSEITLKDELLWIKRVLLNSDEYRCAIEADGKYVGNIYLTNITSEEAYYHIFIGDKSYWGKGIAYDASQQLLEYAFNCLHLNRVLLEVRPDNYKAIHLYRGIGFEFVQSDDSVLMTMELKKGSFQLGKKRPLVSVICLTYNQELFVRDCFEGFVMQQTSFPYEVLVYDDASTDSTPIIIKEYTDKYPEIFKPTLYEKNNFSQGLGYVGFYTGIREAKGKYVAYCEGDDYWTDPLKLQKQVVFLESHPGYEVCAHDVRVRSANDKDADGRLLSQTERNLFIPISRQHYSFDDMLTGNIYHVSSMVYRNNVINLPSWIHRVSAGDMVLYRLLGEKGDLWVMPDVMSVYRDHSDSLTNSRKEYLSSVSYYLQLSIPVLRLLNRYWGRKYQAKIYPIISCYYAECAILYTRKSIRNFEQSKKMARMAICYSKKAAVPYICKGLAKRILRVK